MTGASSRHLRLAAALLAAAAVLGLFLPADAATKKRRKPKPTPTRTVKKEPPPAPRAPDPNRVTLVSADGVSLAASWRPVEGLPESPAVLLLHDFSRDRRQWDDLAPLLAEHGLATLALDLRAHGESGTRAGAGRPHSPSPRLLKDPNGFPRDVEAACAWLRGKTPRVGVMGLSLGGNLAILATASAWAEAAVVLSVSTDKLSLLAGKRPTAPRGTLVLYAESDPGRAAAARGLILAAVEPKRSLGYPGSAHNLDLFTAHPGSRAEALDWLSRLLGAVPRPAPTPEPAPPPVPTTAP